MCDTGLANTQQMNVATHLWSFERAIDETRDDMAELDRQLTALSPDELASFRRDFSVFQEKLSENLTRFLDEAGRLRQDVDDANDELFDCESRDDYEGELESLERDIEQTVCAFRRTFDWFRLGGRDLRDMEDAMRDLEEVVR